MVCSCIDAIRATPCMTAHVCMCAQGAKLPMDRRPSSPAPPVYQEEFESFFNNEGTHRLLCQYPAKIGEDKLQQPEQSYVGSIKACILQLHIFSYFTAWVPLLG